MATKTFALSKWNPGLAAAGLAYGYQNFPQYGPWPSSNGNNNNLAARHMGLTKSTRYRGRRFKRTSFKERVMQIAPAFHKTIADNVATATILHNGIFSYNITAQVVQGTTNQDRVGDAIQLLALKLNGLVATGTPVGAYQIRVLVGWSGEEYNPATLGSGLGSSEIFLPGTGANYTTNSIVNPKAFTVIHDEVMDINSVTANAELSNVMIKVPVRGKFSYQSSGSVYGKTRNLYLVVTGVVIGGTSGVTTVASFQSGIDLVFKNL